MPVYGLCARLVDWAIRLAVETWPLMGISCGGQPYLQSLLTGIAITSSNNWLENSSDAKPTPKYFSLAPVKTNLPVYDLLWYCPCCSRENISNIISIYIIIMLLKICVSNNIILSFDQWTTTQSHKQNWKKKQSVIFWSWFLILWSKCIHPSALRRRLILTFS